MSHLKVERIGGFAGFGGLHSRLRSIGEIDIRLLSQAEKQLIEELFKSHAHARSKAAADTFRYRISRITNEGTESIEAEEAMVPAVIRQCVKDEII